MAICDVDERILAAAAKKYPKAKTYVDFRKMLAEMEKSIDAVMVSTPDHTHAPAAAMAMRMGKHCYCEKPLAHTVYEARVLAQLAKEKNLVTQMGTQIHAEDNYRRVVELVQAGAIGPVSEVRVWCKVKYGGVKRPTETPAVPEDLHWDLWLGPAPFRPYHPCYVPFRWRNWWDFGTGGLGDFGCHLMDLPFWALKLRHPTTIEAEGPPVDPESSSPGLTVHYEYAARGDLPPVKLTWYDGDKADRAGTPAGLQHSRRQHGRAVHRQGRACCGPTTAAERSIRKRSSKASSRRSRRSPTRSATTRSFSRPARPAARPPATSTTPAR